jgi:hypothetical protein
MKRILTLVLIFIGIGVSNAQSTYNDIKSALIENCAACHREGGGAPFSVLNYAETSTWKSAIKHELQEGSMPPWAPDTNYMHFVGEREISEEDKNAIITWVDEGGIQGDSSQEPVSPAYPSSLLNGIPDLVLDMPMITSNAASTDAYNTVVFSTGLNSPRKIRAIEVVPENAELTHHVLVNADEAGVVQNDLTGYSFDVEGSIVIGTYAPGTNPIIFPNSDEIKLGVTLPANADMVLQIHTPNYTSTGASLGEEINIQLKIFFYDEGETGIREVYNFTPLQYWENDFVIPAGEIRSFQTEIGLDQFTDYDLSFYSSFPHSHQICSKIKNYAFKGTDTIPLISIDNWDFEHQEVYYYKSLLRVPVDYALKAWHEFDNTADNHHNPFSPPQTIGAGFNSDDEMLFDGFQVVVAYPGDHLINIDSILLADPLMNYDEVITGINTLASKPLKNSFVSPNPISDFASIYFVNDNKEGTIDLRVYDMTGKQVEVDFEVNTGSLLFYRSGLSSGMYSYQIIKGGDLYTVGNLVVE